MKSSTKTAWIGNMPSSPLGPIWIAVSEIGLAALDIQPDREKFITYIKKLGFSQVIEEPARITKVVGQLDEFLSGKRPSFDLPLDWSTMDEFQENVLRITYAIPYGQTRTYGDIARQLNKPQAARAVGRAEATNPIALVIPCHRVIGSDGKLHGYGGGKGIETKAWLLALEKGS